MPYRTITDLPNSVTDHTPKHAQEIYLAAFNSAYDEYKQACDRKKGSDHEETAHRVAWSAVKKSYSKGSDGRWHKK